jgi:hypothetical protein
MVLSLPILLVMMALMILFGHAVVWKVQGLAAARHAVWSSRSPRWGLSFPRPQYWLPPALMNRAGDPDARMLDDPRVDLPVARGPTLPYGTTVNRDLLDPSRGMSVGGAALQRPFPFLHVLGDCRFRAYTQMLDNKWQYWDMQWTDAAGNRHWGVPSNVWRRIPVIYALAKAPPALSTAYVQAVLAILRAPFRRDLFPLDRDDEFIGYSQRFVWRSGAPDFHPRLRSFCDLDHAAAQQKVDELIDRIQGKKDPPPRVPSVAEVMTRAWINLYNRVINELQNQINGVPPPSPGQIAAMKAEIAQLQKQIDVLNTFLQTLQ